MKKTTQEIFDLLNNEDINQNLESLSASHSEHEHLELTMSEAYNRYLFIKEVTLKSIELNLFDSISIKRRVPILNNLKELKTHCKNVNKSIDLIETIFNLIEASNLEQKVVKDWSFEQELAELSKLKASYTRFNNKFKETKKNLDFINESKSDLEEVIEGGTKKLELLTNKNEEASKELKTIENLKIDAESKTQKIKEEQKQVDALKLNINSFSENIDEYKEIIEGLTEKGEAVISKESKIIELIEQAEKALQLKSAEGISAAFSSKYDELKKVKVNKWIWGASSLLAVAVALTVWSLTGKGINNPDGFGSIAGRIVAVGIAISGAAFCANQFIKQKNIAEDYGYKAVLSKSIIAFAKYIKETDGSEKKEKVSEYLTKVLEEIHKDPLRERRTKKVGVDKASILQIKEISDLLK